MNKLPKYISNPQFSINVGFDVSTHSVLDAVTNTNNFLIGLPETLYKSVDFKTMGALIGSIFCDKLVKVLDGAMVNPIEKGHPDIIPIAGLSASEGLLRNYPVGLEIKGTIGNVKQGCNLRAGQRRIEALTGITWQAHHREVNYLLGFLWDFSEENNGFCFPNIVGVFFSDNLTVYDWGEISGTTGRNTKVTAMVKSGKEKMGRNWVIMLNDKAYYTKMKRFLHFDDLAKNS